MSLFHPRFTTFFCCISLLLIPSQWAMANDTPAITFDSIAATVYGKAITCYDVQRDMQDMQQQLQLQGGGQLDKDLLFERALDGQILWQLQQREATKMELTISDDEVDNAIKKVEEGNRLQPGQLKELLKAQGMDYDRYVETLHKRMLSNKLINLAVRSHLKISEESIHEYYRKYLEHPQPRREIHLAQIFIGVSSDSDSPSDDLKKAETTIQMVSQKLQQHEAFSKLVTLYSNAPDSSSGGDMGWFFPGGIAPSFAEVFNLPVGETSQIIRSQRGFHIVKVTEERWQEPDIGKSYDEVHARHILLQVPQNADIATRAKIMDRIQNIARELKNSNDETFAARAKEISQGPSSSRGGDLGWFRRGQMVPAFEDVAFKLKAGETSGIVESPFGFHIIHMIATRHVDPNSLLALHDQIQEALTNAEMQVQAPRWLASLKAKARIETTSCPNIDTSQSTTPTSAPTTGKQSPTSIQSDTAEEALLRWKKAWESQNFKDYLAAYSDQFQPEARFSNIDAWKSYKRRAIANKSSIQVDMSQTHIKKIDDQHLSITFMQRYTADTYSDQTRKQLDMTLENHLWKITREQELP